MKAKLGWHLCFRVTIVVQPCLKFIQCPEPLGLAHLTVNGDGPKTKVAEHEGNAPGIVAGAREQHHRTAGQLREHICQIAVLCGTTFAVNTGCGCSPGFAQVLTGDIKGDLMQVRQRSVRLPAPSLRTRSSRCAAGGRGQGRHLVFGRNEEILLAQRVHSGILGGDLHLHRIPQTSPLQFGHLQQQPWQLLQSQQQLHYKTAQ